MFALLTGRPPFVGRRVTDLLAQVAASNLDDTPLKARTNVSESLRDVCRRCLSKDQAGRFASARELAEALRGLKLVRGGALGAQQEVI